MLIITMLIITMLITTITTTTTTTTMMRIIISIMKHQRLNSQCYYTLASYYKTISDQKNNL